MMPNAMPADVLDYLFSYCIKDELLDAFSFVKNIAVELTIVGRNVWKVN